MRDPAYVAYLEQLVESLLYERREHVMPQGAHPLPDIRQVDGFWFPTGITYSPSNVLQIINDQREKRRPPSEDQEAQC